MPLKIVKSSEPMNIANIVLTIYAAPGLGKTSLAFTANKPLLLDFDKGAYRAAKRGDAVSVAAWSDVQEMNVEDLAAYSTIIVDTAGRALDALANDIIVQNPKSGRADGTLTLQGFGTLKSRFSQWQSYLRSMGKDLVLICHMDEQKNGDETTERIDAQGSSKNEIYKSSDAMCRIRLDAKDNRYLDFDPRQGGFGKNPAQLPRIPFASPTTNPNTLAETIAQIKKSINRISAEQAKAIMEQQQWAAAIADADTLELFNAVILPLAKERKGEFKKFVEAKAKDRGYIYDAKTKLFAEEAVPA